MNDKTILLIVLGILVTAFGLFLSLGAARRYRRELGILKAGQDKTQDVSFIINAFQDVTRQLKEKERELERLKALAESRAENILQCVSNGVITFDGSGRVNTVNRAAVELLGRDRAELAGRQCAEVFDNSEICGIIHDALERHVTLRRMETVMFRKGERIWLGFNIALLTDRQGNSLGAILSFSDLTEVKRLQEQIELKERLTALGEMSAGIAHELRNPMAVIAGYLKLLARKQDAAGQATIRDITAEIDGMNRIIEDLLTFARPAALNRGPVRIKDLLENCVETARERISASGAVARTLRLEDVSVPADEGLLRQALANIVQNAVDAMPSGGTLSVAAAAAAELVITVRDTGHGIAPENLRKVFLPFFTTREEGVGMGLALAHKIITSHGGRIEVASEEGKGTTFTIALPRE